MGPFQLERAPSLFTPETPAWVTSKQERRSLRSSTADCERTVGTAHCTFVAPETVTPIAQLIDASYRYSTDPSVDGYPQLLAMAINWH